MSDQNEDQKDKDMRDLDPKKDPKGGGGFKPASGGGGNKPTPQPNPGQ